MCFSVGTVLFLFSTLNCVFFAVLGDNSDLVHVSLLQMDSNALDANLKTQKAVQFFVNASTASPPPDLVVMPRDWLQQSDLPLFTSLAKSYKTNVVVTYSQSNMSVVEVLDQSGTQILLFRKNMSSLEFPQGGQNFQICAITTKQGVQVKVGVMLDDDMLFSESARVLMILGAELIVVPANSNIPPLYYNFTMTRASENTLTIALANTISAFTNGNSLFFTWCSDSYPGCTQAGNSEFRFGNFEGIFTKFINISDYRNYQKYFTFFGDAGRRPYSYRSLCGLDYDDARNKKIEIEPNDTPFNVSIATIQMAPSMTPGDILGNMQIAKKFIAEAAEQGADIALLPELWSIGFDAWFPVLPYYFNNSQTEIVFEFNRNAVGSGAPNGIAYLQFFQDLAQELQIAIATTYLEEWDEGDSPPRNTVTLIDRFGNIVYSYSKVHTFNFAVEEGLTTPGRQFKAQPLNTKKGVVMVGSIICYDRSFPEATRITATQRGAEILLVPNACVLSTSMLAELQSRAFENVVGIVLSNYVGIYNGNSVIYDFAGNELIRSPTKEEHIGIANIDISALRNRRNSDFGKSLFSPKKFIELCGPWRLRAYNQRNAFSRSSGSAV